jgi:hypothetical protein
MASVTIGALALVDYRHKLGYIQLPCCLGVEKNHIVWFLGIAIDKLNGYTVLLQAVKKAG